MIPVFQDNRWEGELNGSEISELQNFASTSNSAAGLMAKNILEFFYENQPGAIMGKKELRVEYTRLDDIHVGPDLNWSLAPNPTREKLSITLMTFDPKAIYKCQLINTNGRIVKAFLLNSKENQICIPEIPKGLYFLKLLKDDVPAITNKLIVE